MIPKKIACLLSFTLRLVLVSWATSSAVLAAGVAYPRLEASFGITNLATDPFDYTVTDVRVQITQPDGTVLSLPAFFDGGTTWRVRHAPVAAGRYSISGVALNGQPLSVNNLQPAGWTVSGFATDPGFVRVDPLNPRRFITSNGRRFFPHGENLAWDSGGHNVPDIMLKMGPAHENWGRVWMEAFTSPSQNLDWPKVGGTFGQLSLPVAQKWDGIVSAAEQSGVHFQMTLQHHGQYSTTVDPNWAQNPYNTANGGFLSSPVQFFTNSMAKALTKRKLRYAVARWGYSTSVIAWELFNEVQFTDAGQTGQWSLIQAWHDEMASFLRSQDAYQHLITTSSELNEPLWDQTDYYQHHDYPSDLITGIRGAADISGSQTVGPDFSGECGIDTTPHVGISPPIWSGLMAGQSGDAMPWYWDTIDANNDYPLFHAASDFITRCGMGDQDVLTQSTPQVTGGPLSPLVFAPSGGFTTATQDTFTVVSSAPDGIAAAPSYLQGNFHRSMTPNGYSFLVNYTQAGTFSAQIITIASSGAGFQMFLDGVVQTNVSFPAGASDVSTNLTFTISVAAGSHTVKLYNPGQDWVQLGSITLNPYVAMLGAYAVGNTNFEALWVWHRTNVFLPNATATVTGTVTLSGLNAGSYTATWWDTFADVALTNFNVNVAVSNVSVSVPTPSILRSAALYVGGAPQASLGVPALAQTVGTNSPLFSVPLTITNSGGLPLGYSLSVTGANPVAYAALNSSQPGGPVYAWRDISGIGQDISGSFAALTGTNTAKDEGIAGPINIGFGFPFFSGAQSPGSYTQLYVSPNGYVAFSPFSGNTAVNTVLPGSSAPSNCIAFFWDDLDLGANGRVYAASDPIDGTFTLQFQNVNFKGGASSVTCELILKTTGEMLMQYRSMAFSNTCTVGLQNAARNQGLTVAFNQNYLQTNLAVRLSPTSWLSLSMSAGWVPKSGIETVAVGFNATGLTASNYNATLLVNTTDSLHPVTALPVSFTLSPLLPAAPSGLTVSSITWSQVGLSWNDNSGNESGFQIERKIGAGGVYGPVGSVAANATNFTDGTVASRTTYYYRVVATNASGNSLYSDEVGAVTPIAPIDTWRQTHFGAPDNTGPAANTADPDHDGLINIIEYAFNLDPNVPSPNPITYAVVGNHLTISFKRTHPAPADINYITEVSSNLSAGVWSSGPAFTSQGVMDNGDGTETVTIIDLVTVGSSSTHYLRVRIGLQ